jgi:hypothetical protein
MTILNMHPRKTNYFLRLMGEGFLPPTFNVFPLVPIEFSIMVPQDFPYSSALLSHTFIYIYINHKGGPKEEAPLYFYFGE